MKIAAVGDNCIDHYYLTNQSYPGGNSVNVSVYVRRLGEQSSYVGAVGNDENGRFLQKALADKGVDVSHLHVLPGATAVTRVRLLDGDRQFDGYDEGVLADFRLSQEDISFIASHDLMFTGLWGKREKDLPALKAAGVKIAFDFANKYDHPIVRQALPWVDYAFFSADGLEESVEAFLRRVYSQGPRYVICTMGEQGSMVYDGQRFYSFGIIPCRVVDTMGAGDSYIAGFLTSHLQGCAIPQAMEAGARCSSETLQYFGGWEPERGNKP